MTISNALAFKLFNIGFPQRGKAIPYTPNIEEVLDWFKLNQVFIENTKVNGKYCYRYYSIENKQESQKVGCRANNGYNTPEEAYEAAINKIIQKSNKQ